MTEPDDSSETQPISVAELLARHGTIGAPPVGGRRRRRRGDTAAVTVAELTGEIPVIQAPLGEDSPAPSVEAEPAPEAEAVEEPELAEEAQLAEDLEEHVHDLTEADVPAEEMLPDSLEIVDIDVDEGTEEEDAATAVDESPIEVAEPPTYMHAVRQELFGGRFEDDPVHHGKATQVTDLPEVPPETTMADDHEEVGPPSRLAQIGRGTLTVLQSVLAVAFGAGLFIAFDELWKWNYIVALVLSVLVILGLVVAVQVVRKTQDITSTLIAVAVGALITLGPLALLHSG